MSSKTLPREPWRGSMICGEQIAYGLPWDKFCAERKGDDLPMCPEHFQEAIEEYGTVTVPPNVALGENHWAVRLLWEGEDPDMPIEASAEEIARYAAILTPERGE